MIPAHATIRTVDGRSHWYWADEDGEHLYAADPTPRERPKTWDETFGANGYTLAGHPFGPLNKAVTPDGFVLYVSYRRFAEALASANVLAGLFDTRYRVQQAIQVATGYARWTVTWIEPT